jgi:hypothetical protein
VTPYGDLVATSARGTLYGNRGCLHDDRGRIVRWAVGRRWIACELAFKGRRRTPFLQPGRYTELFFLDEATALAAGHRPCVECRRADFVRFADAFAAGNRLATRPRAAEIDAQLQPERPMAPTTRRNSRRHRAGVDDLPDGVMVDIDGSPHLVVNGQVRTWSHTGYGPPIAPPSDPVAVLTPASIVRTLAAGYVPRV